MPPAAAATTDTPAVADNAEAIAAAAAAEALANEQGTDGAAAKATPTADELQAQADADADVARVAAEQADQAAIEQAKKDGGVSKRFSKLSADAKTAQREAAEAKRRAELAEAAVAELTAAAKPKAKDPADEMPEKPEFENPDQYADAMTDYTDKLVAYRIRTALRAEQAEAAKVRAESDARASHAKVQQDFKSRVDAFMAETPDYEEVAGNPDISISVAMAAGIARSPQGPKVAYYLGSNPAEAARIAALSDPAEQLMEIGALAKQLSAPVVNKTNAARPIRAINGGTTTTAKDPGEMSMEEYAAHRNRKGATH